ncbi:MAG: N-6 DNA methylase [Fusobacterium sp.]|nr:N-6 DNA methylase [Fusobacterium sp.]
MNNLFNDKILSQKADEEVDLSKNNLAERRKYLNKWIDMLENGVLDKTKEEQLQGEFISDIFSKVLNASNITDGKDEWNLERETKTLMDGQKADGTLGFFDSKGKKDIRALIELKGANINLDARQKRAGDTHSAVEQAFGYAPKYGRDCHWIIVSNFKEIRLYRANSMLEYQVFFLEKLRDDLEFKKFIYVLSFYALVGTENKKAKSLELSEEYQKVQNEIEKKFYNEYKKIRIDIFENMKNNNPEISELVIIEKVQKLLDRFLFICFCEDKGLIPENSYSNLVKRGELLEDIFESFKSFCNWINTGNKSKNIPHFNGGLFKPDSVLDNLFVDDEVFRKLEKISDYDFDSDLNESILGHIFEQSVSDIEELKKTSQNEEFDKKESKRKKDGIFYTPKYITKYIVESTMNAWIEDKKKELGEENLPELQEKDFKYDLYKKNYSKNFRKHVEFWEKFREELRKIKIIDPACGSGAFLIEAFDFLLKYNQMIDDKIFNMTGTKNLFDDTTKEILENNIFGVDLNKESVEITKLSLWLRTANKEKTLATLENNIKCGNSLISDKNLCERGFDWKEEFPEIFENGGFDIVIGNPPYVSAENIKELEKEYYKNNYKVATGRQNLYIIFYERGIELLNKNGYLSFITPYTILKNKYYMEARKYILENSRLLKLIDFKNVTVFEDAVVDSIILVLKKEQSKNYDFEKIYNIKNFGNNEYSSKTFAIENVYINQDFSLEFSDNLALILKMQKNSLKLKNIIEFKQGIITGNNKKFLTNEISENTKKVITGKDFNRYFLNYNGEYVIYDVDKLHRPRKKEIFEIDNKILLRQTGAFPICTIDNNHYYTLDTVHNGKIINSDFSIFYILTLLNSKVLKFYYIDCINEEGKVYAQVKIIYIDELPIKNISLKKQKPFIEKADTMLELNKELQNKIKKFKNRLSSNLDLKEFSKKMESFYELNFKEFLKELGKQKIKLSLSQQDEWEEYFEDYKNSILEIKQKISQTDKEIDLMIYKLYELTEEEIKIIEENF